MSQMQIYISEVSGDTAKYDEAKELLENIGFDVMPKNEADSLNIVGRIDRLMSCNYLYLMDGWSLCKESRIEYAVAREMNIPVLFETNFVPTHPKIVMIQDAIYQVTGLTLKDYASTSRTRNVFFARMLFVHFCHENGFRMTQIASFVQRDHSTIAYVINKYPDEYTYNFQFRELANKVRRIIEHEKNLQQ